MVQQRRSRLAAALPSPKLESKVARAMPRTLISMRELRLALLGLSAIIAIVLGASFTLRAFKTDPSKIPVVAAPQGPDGSKPDAPAAGEEVAALPATAPLRSALAPEALEAARVALDKSIAATPDYARFFGKLKAVFPEEYDSILNTLAEASQGKDIDVDKVMADAVASLRHAHGMLAAKAPDDALGQIFNLQLEEMKALASKDPHLCVAFLYGANVTGFSAFAADHRPLVADAAIAGLEAMDGGRAQPVNRGAPSDSDFQTLDRALVEKGLSRPEIDALLDGKSPQPPIPDQTMCEAGQSYLATLSTLPADVRARLYGLAVDLMAKS
jgi:hypothetical protein